MIFNISLASVPPYSFHTLETKAYRKTCAATPTNPSIAYASVPSLAAAPVFAAAFAPVAVGPEATREALIAAVVMLMAIAVGVVERRLAPETTETWMKDTSLPESIVDIWLFDIEAPAKFALHVIRVDWLL